MEKAIELTNISVTYGDVAALSDINLTVPTGDFVGIIGPNGSGKSTLLKVMLGLVKPVAGSVTIFGRPVWEARGLISYVPQVSAYTKNFPINAFDVVLSGCLVENHSPFSGYTAKDRETANSIMEKLDIYSLRNRQIGQLSGGQLKRVLIARALAVNPRILLLDEPTASLDAQSTSQIYALLDKLNQTMTIVLVTHDLSVISSYLKSLACINKHLHYHGEPELTTDIINSTFGFPVELVAHGVPHRVLPKHGEELND